MTVSHTIYTITTALAVVVLAFFLYFLSYAEIEHGVEFYRFAWYALLVSVVCMEIRVRLGYRIPRGRLFYTHLAFAIPFFLALTALAFVTQPLWLIAVCDLLLAGLAFLGFLLFFRGVRRHILKRGKVATTIPTNSASVAGDPVQ